MKYFLRYLAELVRVKYFLRYLAELVRVKFFLRYLAELVRVKFFLTYLAELVRVSCCTSWNSPDGEILSSINEKGMWYVIPLIRNKNLIVRYINFSIL